MLVGVLARHVEAVGIREHLGVAVGAGQQGRHHGPLRHVASAKDRVVDDRAAGEQHGRVVTQHLVDRARPQVRLLTQGGELLGVSLQEDDAVAQEVHRGLEAGREHQARGRLQLDVVQLHAVLVLRQHELAQEVVTRVASYCGDVVVEPALERAQRPLHRTEPSQREADVQARRGPLPELEHLQPVLVRDAEDLGDDGHRQQRAVAIHEVDRVARVRCEVVEQLVGDVLGALLQASHRLDGEHSCDELAVAGVLRRLDREQRWWCQRSDGGAAIGPALDGSQRSSGTEVDPGVHVGTAEHLLHGGVRGRDVGERALVQRAPRADLLEQLERQLGVLRRTAVAGGRHDEARLEITAPGSRLDADTGQRVAEAPARQ